MWHTYILGLNHGSAEMESIIKGITSFASYFLTWSNLPSSSCTENTGGQPEAARAGGLCWFWDCFNSSCRLWSCSQHPCCCEYFEILYPAWQKFTFFSFRCTQWVLYRCSCSAGRDGISGSTACPSGTVGACPRGWQAAAKQKVQKGLCYDPFVLVCESDARNCLSSRSLFVLIPFVRALRKLEALVLILLSFFLGVNRTGKDWCLCLKLCTKMQRPLCKDHKDKCLGVSRVSVQVINGSVVWGAFCPHLINAAR